MRHVFKNLIWLPVIIKVSLIFQVPNGSKLTATHFLSSRQSNFTTKSDSGESTQIVKSCGLNLQQVVSEGTKIDAKLFEDIIKDQTPAVKITQCRKHKRCDFLPPLCKITSHTLSDSSMSKKRFAFRNSPKFETYPWGTDFQNLECIDDSDLYQECEQCRK